VPRQEILPPLSARPRLEIEAVDDEAGLAAALTAAAGQASIWPSEIRCGRICSSLPMMSTFC
jgi:hypothetical protein